MTGPKITVNSRKYDQSLRKTWTCELIERNGPLIILVGEFDRDVEHPGLGSIPRGTVSYEYYWFDRWYNVFRFLEPNGSLRNYYCNVSMPPQFENGVLDYVDLDIDVLVWNDLSYEIVDRDDFERNALKYGYPHEIRQRSDETMVELTKMIDGREFPFDQELAG